MLPLTSLELFRAPTRLQLLDLLSERNLPVRGVVHVGGHEAHELEGYLACGLDPILYCEPHPQTFTELERHLGFWRGWLEALARGYGLRAPRLISVRKAIANHGERAVFHRTLQEMCSSLLAPASPQITALDTVEVECARLDDVMAEQQVAPEAVSFLNIDTQGADLMVLEGAPKLLAQVPLILIELNFEERYRGCPLAGEVDAYLQARGFHQVTAHHPPGYPAADALYSR